MKYEIIDSNSNAAHCLSIYSTCFALFHSFFMLMFTIIQQFIHSYIKDSNLTSGTSMHNIQSVVTACLIVTTTEKYGIKDWQANDEAGTRN